MKLPLDSRLFQFSTLFTCRWLLKTAMRPIGPIESTSAQHNDCVLVVGVSRPKLAAVFLTVMLLSLFLTFHVLYDSAVYSIQVSSQSVIFWHFYASFFPRSVIVVAEFLFWWADQFSSFNSSSTKVTKNRVKAWEEMNVSGSNPIKFYCELCCENIDSNITCISTRLLPVPQRRADYHFYRTMWSVLMMMAPLNIQLCSQAKYIFQKLAEGFRR